VYNLGGRNAYANLDIAQVANSALENDKLEYFYEVQEEIIDSYMSSEKMKAAGFFVKYDFNSAMVDIASNWSM